MTTNNKHATHAAAEQALTTAEFFQAAATVAAAWAAEEFTQGTAKEAFERGWDSDDENPFMYGTRDGRIEAIYSSQTGNITMSTIGGVWEFDPRTGKIEAHNG